MFVLIFQAHSFYALRIILVNICVVRVRCRNMAVTYYGQQKFVKLPSIFQIKHKIQAKEENYMAMILIWRNYLSKDCCCIEGGHPPSI